MLVSSGGPDTIDERTVDVIAERVRAALRADLEALAGELLGGGPGPQLTVDQVAQRLGVARSTVYTHWREWGGYKLGVGSKAPIRFDSSALPIERPKVASRQAPVEGRSRAAPRRRSRADLLPDAPRVERARNRG
jgi:hypothetical protein